MGVSKKLEASINEAYLDGFPTPSEKGFGCGYQSCKGTDSWVAATGICTGEEQGLRGLWLSLGPTGWLAPVFWEVGILFFWVGQNFRREWWSLEGCMTYQE